MSDPTRTDVEHSVAAWMSNQRPDIQGDRDGKAGIPTTDSSEITPYERQLVESFEKQIRMVKRKFSEKEAELYFAFKNILATLKDTREDYFRLRRLVGDRDPEVYVPIPVLCFISLLALAGLSIINWHFFSPVFDNAIMPPLLGVLLATSQIIVAYYSGRLIRRHGLKLRLILFLSFLYLCLASIFAIVLVVTHLDQKEAIFSMANLVVFLIVTGSTFFAFDSEPNYPTVQKLYNRLTKEAMRLALDRVKNREKHMRDQEVFIEGAQELDKLYRKSIQSCRPQDDIRIIRESICPTFEPVALELQCPDEISKLLESSL